MAQAQTVSGFMLNSNLAHVSLDSFSPPFAEALTLQPLYHPGTTAISYINRILGGIPGQICFTLHPSPAEVRYLTETISRLVQATRLIDAKASLQIIPHLLIAFPALAPHASKELAVISPLSRIPPCAAKSLAVAWVIRCGGFNFCRQHLLRIAKDVAHHVVAIFQSDSSSSVIRAFALSVVVPSLTYQIPDVTRPHDYHMLPDPVHMLRYRANYTEQHFAYACHVMQLCYRLLIRAVTNVEDHTLFAFVMLNSESFTRACLSRALKVSIGSETNQGIVAIIERCAASNDPILIESLFQWNASLSFRRLSPIVPAIFGSYFTAHNRDLSPALRLLASTYQLDPVDAAEALDRPDFLLKFGNPDYLTWLIIFLTRVRKAGTEVRTQIAARYMGSFMAHLKLLSRLFDSARGFFDPLIDELLCVAMRAIVSFIHDFNTDAMAPRLFPFICTALRFLLGVSVTDTASALAIEVAHSHRAIACMLRNRRRAFATIAASRRDLNGNPVMALILAELPIGGGIVTEVIQNLIVSDDIRMFGCAAALAASHPNASLSDLLFQFVFGGEKFAPGEMARILTRLCLILAIASENAEFQAAFPKSQSFGLFCATFRERIVGPSIAANCLRLQEAAVFFLGSLYKSCHLVHRPVQLDPFYPSAGDMDPVTRAILLEGKVPPLIETVENSLVLPWRQKFAFHHLLENPGWVVSLPLVPRTGPVMEPVAESETSSAGS
jgi:hypothetical protein